MKVDANAPEEMDLDFEIPEPGRYVWQINEGIKVLEKEDGRKSLQIPMVVDQPVAGEGNPEAAGLNGNLFIPLIDKNGESKFGEKELNVLFSVTGLLPKAGEKFGEENVSLTDDRLILFVKKELPGKYVQLLHQVEERNGKRFMSVKSIAKVGAKGSERTATPSANDSQSETKSSW